jgi:hypothetical protein
MKRNIDYTMPLVKIYNYMIEYQKKNNIKKLCYLNAYYYYKKITQGGICANPPKVKIVICVARIPGPSTNSPERFYINHNHMVLIHPDGTIIDPSYEITQIPNINYCLTIREANDILKYGITPEGKPTRLSKEQVNGFIQAIKNAKRINNGVALTKAQRKYYNEQADYVETRMREGPRIINIKIL